MKESILKNILKNGRTFIKNDIRKENNKLRQCLLEQEALIEDLKYRCDGIVLYNRIMSYYYRHQKEMVPYVNELDYISELGEFTNFPYQGKAMDGDVIVGRDDRIGLPFVLHRGKKLYYPRSWNTDDVKRMYVHYMTEELFLETDDSVVAPHQYQSGKIKVNEGDVVFDIGSAEGLFALDIIDQSRHVYIVEGNSLWKECLKQTFKPYQDKVTIIDKYIGESEEESQTTLQILLDNADFETAFVKMDIEGSEVSTLRGARDFLQLMKKQVKFSCAAYHRQNDAEVMRLFFQSLGYKTEFSKGFMLFYNFDTPAPPFFRQGIIRAVRE